MGAGEVLSTLGGPLTDTLSERGHGKLNAALNSVHRNRKMSSVPEQVRDSELRFKLNAAEALPHLHTPPLRMGSMQPHSG